MKLDAKKIAAMKTGGALLATVKETVAAAIVPGVSFEDLEAVAMKTIVSSGALPSFPTVPGYHHATCITKNEGCCHGVPVGHTVEEGDIVTVDVGLIYDGYHVDTTITRYAGDTQQADPEILEFLRIGQQALDAAIAKAVAGNSVYDISKAIQDTIEKAGYAPVYQLTGHGVGKKLHEDPYVPCVAYASDKKLKLKAGMTLALEPMYAMGNSFLVLGKDGWTYETKDKSLTGMFEDTVLITDGKPEILTRIV